MAAIVRASELLAAAKLNARLEKKPCQMYHVPLSAIDGNAADYVCVCKQVVSEAGARIGSNPTSMSKRAPRVTPTHAHPSSFRVPLQHPFLQPFCVGAGQVRKEGKQELHQPHQGVPAGSTHHHGSAWASG